MALLKDLVVKKPDDNSGSSSSNRFQYQKDWALCKIMDSELKNKDLVMILDYHDDILILDSKNEPEKVEFYQIKTKRTGNWNITSLSSGKKTNSFIGKLILNKLKFNNYDVRLFFVSNARYNIEIIKSGTNEEENISAINTKEICLEILEQKEKDKLTKRLIREFEDSNIEEYYNIIYLQASDMNIEGREEYTIGKIAKYFYDKYPENNVNSVVAYKMLSNELARKNDYEWDICNIDELIKLKSISSQEFCVYIEKLMKNSIKYADIDSIKSSIDNEKKFTLSERKRIKRNIQDYEIRKLNAYNTNLRDIITQIIRILNRDDEYEDYFDLTNKIFSEIDLENIDKKIFSYEYIKAIIIWEFENHE